MDLAHAMFLAGIKQDPLGRSGLAGIYVRDDADIPDSSQRSAFRVAHGLPLPLQIREWESGYYSVCRPVGKDFFGGHAARAAKLRKWGGAAALFRLYFPGLFSAVRSPENRDFAPRTT
ncbi:MAG: hypothetical protein LBU64_10250 [Planctomycetota bacterium]|jgi:hypothetical protein|nr:hypothetical protein [Planctomycetota bacterium]